MNLVVDQMLEALVKGGAQEDLALQGQPRVAAVHHLMKRGWVEAGRRGGSIEKEKMITKNRSTR